MCVLGAAYLGERVALGETISHNLINVQLDSQHIDRGKLL